MELTIQVVSGASERLAVHVPTGAETTVLELKQLIEMQNSVRFPVAAQRLIFQGQILQNEKLLGEYNITTGMALHLTLAPGVAASIAAAAAAAPPGPSTVRAAFASLPPSTRAPTPATLMRQYLQQMQSEAGFETAIQTLRKICENIVGHPTEDKYRKLRLGNAALKARLFDKSRGLDCVRLLGFQDGIEEGHIVLVPTAERWETMTALKRVIDEFASMPPPSAMFGGASTSTAAAGGGLPSAGAGGGDFANMAAQASAMLQNPMMAQTIANHPMMQQMAQSNPMIAQALQNPALLQQMMQQMQQNPGMMQQVSQMMQNPNAMQQMQQMMGGGGGMGGLGGMGFPPSTQANPFAQTPAAAANPFASFASAPATAAPVTSATPPARPAANTSSMAPPAAAAPVATPSFGEDAFEEEDIAAAIARSLEEH